HACFTYVPRRTPLTWLLGLKALIPAGKEAVTRRLANRKQVVRPHRRPPQEDLIAKRDNTAIRWFPVPLHRWPVWLAMITAVLVLALVADHQLAIPARQPVERPRARPPHTRAPVAPRTPPRAAAPAWPIVLLNPEQVD